MYRSRHSQWRLLKFFRHMRERKYGSNGKFQMTKKPTLYLLMLVGISFALTITSAQGYIEMGPRKKGDKISPINPHRLFEGSSGKKLDQFSWARQNSPAINGCWYKGDFESGATISRVNALVVPSYDDDKCPQSLQRLLSLAMDAERFQPLEYSKKLFAAACKFGDRFACRKEKNIILGGDVPKKTSAYERECRDASSGSACAYLAFYYYNTHKKDLKLVDYYGKKGCAKKNALACYLEGEAKLQDATNGDSSEDAYRKIRFACRYGYAPACARKYILSKKDGRVTNSEDVDLIKTGCSAGDGLSCKIMSCLAGGVFSYCDVTLDAKKEPNVYGDWLAKNCKEAGSLICLYAARLAVGQKRAAIVSLILESCQKNKIGACYQLLAIGFDAEPLGAPALDSLIPLCRRRMESCKEAKDILTAYGRLEEAAMAAKMECKYERNTTCLEEKRILRLVNPQNMSVEKATRTKFEPKITHLRPRQGVGIWSKISDVDAPSPRHKPSTVWTGKEVIVWSGTYGTDYLWSGSKYNPSIDKWSQMTVQNAPTPRDNNFVTWTGREMLVWGGSSWGFQLNSGAFYNPESDSWRAMTLKDAPKADRPYETIWTGKYLLVWDNTLLSARSSFFKYDPVADKWEQLSFNFRVDKYWIGSGVAWANSEIVFWGGLRPASHSSSSHGGAVSSCEELLSDSETKTAPVAMGFNPETGVWREIKVLGKKFTRCDPTLYWIDDKILIVGGLSHKMGLSKSQLLELHEEISKMETMDVEMAAEAEVTAEMLRDQRTFFNEELEFFDLKSGKILPLPAINGVPSRHLDGGVIIGKNGLFVRERYSALVLADYLPGPGDREPYGGLGLPSYLYDFKKSKWFPLSLLGAPVIRFYAAEIATDVGLFVWGGRTQIDKKGRVRYESVADFQSGSVWIPGGTRH